VTATDAPARTPGGGLDPLNGALFELTAWPRITPTTKLAYLALAAHPNLAPPQLREVLGRTETTRRGAEGDLVHYGMLDPETRTVLYPRTGGVPARATS
jgi:hypothetical protein